MKNTRSCCSEIRVSQLFLLDSLTCVSYQSVSGIQNIRFSSLSFSNPTVTLYLQSADNPCSPKLCFVSCGLLRLFLFCLANNSISFDSSSIFLLLGSLAFSPDSCSHICHFVDSLNVICYINRCKLCFPCIFWVFAFR